MARETPRIYVTLNNHQDNHQSIIVEVEGKNVKQSISVLIDSGSNHIYVTLKVVEICSLRKMKNDKCWLVQLATYTK